MRQALSTEKVAASGGKARSPPSELVSMTLPAHLLNNKIHPGWCGQRVAGSIPTQGSCMGFRPGPQ